VRNTTNIKIQWCLILEFIRTIKCDWKKRGRVGWKLRSGAEETKKSWGELDPRWQLTRGKGRGTKMRRVRSGYFIAKRKAAQLPPSWRSFYAFRCIFFRVLDSWVHLWLRRWWGLLMEKTNRLVYMRADGKWTDELDDVHLVQAMEELNRLCLVLDL
jgi:hypothetical protein